MGGRVPTLAHTCILHVHEGGHVGCDSWSVGFAMGGADIDDEMGVGLDDEYGLGWNDEVAPSRRKADREAKASRARVGAGAATVATTRRSLCHAESQSRSS